MGMPLAIKPRITLASRSMRAVFVLPPKNDLPMSLPLGFQLNHLVHLLCAHRCGEEHMGRGEDRLGGLESDNAGLRS
jgi:hypothetical protein